MLPDKPLAPGIVVEHIEIAAQRIALVTATPRRLRVAECDVRRRRLLNHLGETERIVAHVHRHDRLTQLLASLVLRCPIEGARGVFDSLGRFAQTRSATANVLRFGNRQTRVNVSDGR